MRSCAKQHAPAQQRNVIRVSKKYVAANVRVEQGHVCGTRTFAASDTGVFCNMTITVGPLGGHSQVVMFTHPKLQLSNRRIHSEGKLASHGYERICLLDPPARPAIQRFSDQNSRPSDICAVPVLNSFFPFPIPSHTAQKLTSNLGIRFSTMQRSCSCRSSRTPRYHRHD